MEKIKKKSLSEITHGEIFCNGIINGRNQTLDEIEKWLIEEYSKDCMFGVNDNKVKDIRKKISSMREKK